MDSFPKSPHPELWDLGTAGFRRIQRSFGIWEQPGFRNTKNPRHKMLQLCPSAQPGKVPPSAPAPLDFSLDKSGFIPTYPTPAAASHPALKCSKNAKLSHLSHHNLEHSHPQPCLGYLGSHGHTFPHPSWKNSPGPKSDSGFIL